MRCLTVLAQKKARQWGCMETRRRQQWDTRFLLFFFSFSRCPSVACSGASVKHSPALNPQCGGAVFYLNANGVDVVHALRDECAEILRRRQISWQRCGGRGMREGWSKAEPLFIAVERGCFEMKHVKRAERCVDPQQGWEEAERSLRPLGSLLRRA